MLANSPLPGQMPRYCEHSGRPHSVGFGGIAIVSDELPLHRPGVPPVGRLAVIGGGASGTRMPAQKGGAKTGGPQVPTFRIRNAVEPPGGPG